MHNLSDDIVYHRMLYKHSFVYEDCLVCSCQFFSKILFGCQACSFFFSKLWLVTGYIKFCQNRYRLLHGHIVFSKSWLAARHKATFNKIFKLLKIKKQILQKHIIHTCNVYSIVENCGISSAGWCCSDMPAYWGGN